jgi:hypothetical protein
MENITTQPITEEIVSMAQKMQTTTIGDDTRSYLILIGKIYDLSDEIRACLRRDYIEEKADEITNDIYINHLFHVKEKLFKLVANSIDNNIGTLNWKEI